MPEVGAIAEKVRSKNAGPFWVTIDIFCGTAEAYERVSRGLTSDTVAAAFQMEVGNLKRFDIPDLRVVKFSLPRPAVQGTASDRDMHGAGWGPMVAELVIP